jgi:hypothetical protein
MPDHVQLTENDIDFAILVDLTDQDLEKIGVASLGYRRNSCGRYPERCEKGAPAVAAASAPAATPRAADAAERTQVTVMFSDSIRRRHGSCKRYGE